jgi:hypothetical protein
VTKEVFHDPIAALKAAAPQNMYDISITLEVSQYPISVEGR